MGKIELGKIEQSWQEFYAVAYPEGSSAQQKEIMRETFFCGSRFMLTEVHSIITKSNDPAEDINTLENELGDFLKSYIAKTEAEGNT